MSRYNPNRGNQSSMSQKDQNYLNDVMGAMQLSSTKYQFYASQCQDRDIRQLCQHIAQHQQDDLQQIRQLSGQSGQQLQ